MPSIKEESDVRARVCYRVGAGEPPGEPPPPGILGAMEDDLRGKLPDELLDELLADASRRRRSSGRAACSRS